MHFRGLTAETAAKDNGNGESENVRPESRGYTGRGGMEGFWGKSSGKNEGIKRLPGHFAGFLSYFV